MRHIAETRALLGADCAIVCAMSGNFVQRGEFAVFEKHARAKAAIKRGADLVIELPVTTSLSSAEKFAQGGIALLDALGVCTHLSFGSEQGEIGPLAEAAECLSDPRIDGLIKSELKKGISYAAARQKALESIIGPGAEVLRTPNNILAVEYLKALSLQGSSMEPMTVARAGGDHDGDSGLSASAIRSALLSGDTEWDAVPGDAARIFKNEISSGRGPVTMAACETAILAKLRTMRSEDYEKLPDAAEGLGERLSKYARTEPTLEAVLFGAKTKRYAMSRLRRMILCAYLGITAADCGRPPEYIRVLAMNSVGRAILRNAAERGKLPIVTKPAAALELSASALDGFLLEAAATDLYVLAYPDADKRAGGQEYRISPSVI